MVANDVHNGKYIEEGAAVCEVRDCGDWTCEGKGSKEIEKCVDLPSLLGVGHGCREQRSEHCAESILAARRGEVTIT